ncbi:pentatricopeptide repeat-containing protein At2g20710, mitochondrial [Ricinus communis]|uniref:Pentatricopeptide repeat-containing protein, putative n=1 Tax=Ricinus communis TaxID=3988 RepID=B9RW07_RICCO|nr:pentatricopeptide repeat-containing protein At2g20710, mitochondrial [Ricinus communis]EEF44444.1 pentatricopeptide repeat-containing protein, putative [Ricinus communis]|eukprot:XP_002517926.1 pentatricopeptide repeat-containing protein At2g20710, mitochondrial [Ricinus communis]
MKLLRLGSNSNLWQSGYQILRAQFLSTSTYSLSSSAPIDTLYGRISKAGKPSISIVPILEKWLEEGNDVKKPELQKFVKQLRKYRRFTHALQVSEWMTDKKGCSLLPGDVAVRLDLISKVHGLVKAEEYFNSIPDTSRDRQVYGALLNCCAHSKLLGKAEATMQKMKDLGFVKNSLSYNVMLSLYSHMGNYEKLDPLVQEMEENGISCDRITYCIRLNACVNSSDIEGMEKLLMKMEVDPNISVGFHAYVIAANGYLKAGLVDKTLIMLKRSEQLISGNTRRFAYEFLLTLYTASGNKAEVYRIWNKYKEIGRFFNSGYICMISSLLKLDDIDGAERIFEEWDSKKVLFDIRIPNSMVNVYSRKGHLEKAETYINKIVASGEEPDATSWNHLAAGYHSSGQMTKAVETIRKAISVSKPGWKPSLLTLSACLEFLKGQGDAETLEELLKIAKEHCCFSAGAYAKLSSCIDNENLTTIALDQMEEDYQNFSEEPPAALGFIEKGST